MPNPEQPEYPDYAILSSSELTEVESPETELLEFVEQATRNLEKGLNDRLKQFGKTERVSLDSPELPENLTQAHIETIKNTLSGGKGLDMRVLPRVSELDRISDAYWEMMYPKEQQPQDTARSLVAKRPSWFDENAVLKGYSFTGTWGQVYIDSIRKELQEIGGSLVLLDTAIKPKYIDGSQHYGSKEGIDASLDPLLALVKEMFGKDANRFDHSYEDIENQLLPKIKEKLDKALKEQGLDNIEYRVILVPLVLDNQNMILNDPDSSSTNTWEWTSTPLIDKNGKEAGQLLLSGNSGCGGAAYAVYVHRGYSYGYGGFRLAVVFK